jgi:CheY-like chemotaxis protein
MGDGGRVILVAEGDDGLRRELLCWLEGEGHSVLSAATGLEALEIARAHEPCLVVLDEDLPWLDGGQVARGIRRDPKLGCAKIVALVSGGPRLRGASKFTDCDATLTLPPRREELIAVTRRLTLPHESLERLKAAPSAGVLAWLQIGRRGA